MEKVCGVVIGAGVVGLAVARSLIQSMPGASRDWLVIEAANAIGTGISSRNSEVIHAGIYYPKASLKARLCLEGRNKLYAYAIERGISHSRCGKLIVATKSNQFSEIEALLKKGLDNGVRDLTLINAKEVQALEPALSCVAALYSPSTGIVDSHGLMMSLQGDFENLGGTVALNTKVISAQCQHNDIVLQMADGSELTATYVVNAAGLMAPLLAEKFIGLPSQYIPRAYFAKGNYFSLAGASPFRHLIYPVPESAGLGVHLTLDLGGQAKFGPDVEWVNEPDNFEVSSANEKFFYSEVRKYWPELRDGELQPSYSGIRPKISGPYQPQSDFCIQGQRVHGVRGLVNLFGIESPGLTSALAIGDLVASSLCQR